MVKNDNIYDILDNLAINLHGENLDKTSAEEIEKILFNLDCFNDRLIITHYFYNSSKSEYTKEEVLNIIQKNKYRLKKNIQFIENLIKIIF